MNRSSLGAYIGVFLCLASLLYLQNRFDKSDQRKAQRLVQNLRSETRRDTFGEFLVHKHGDRPGVWGSDITGGCRGVVRVTWTSESQPPVLYAWEVEIPAQAIHPVSASPDGERMLQEFTAEQDELPPLKLPPLEQPPE